MADRQSTQVDPELEIQRLFRITRTPDVDRGSWDDIGSSLAQNVHGSAQNGKFSVWTKGDTDNRPVRRGQSISGPGVGCEIKSPCIPDLLDLRNPFSTVLLFLFSFQFDKKSKLNNFFSN